MYINKSDDTVYKYNNTYYSTIKKSPVDVKLSTCINFTKESNIEDPKLGVGDHVRISKCKYIFPKD